MAKSNYRKPTETPDDMFTGLCTRVERMTNTVNGNPRYKLTIDVGSEYGPLILFTMPDSSMMYRHEWHSFEGRRVLFTTRSKGDRFYINNISHGDICPECGKASRAVVRHNSETGATRYTCPRCDATIRMI